ncbi:facilitated trehalose transporter Tret1-like isoform X1 [Rhynchophorus ferrugineus]|uniref:facilitated trehalose transporter Tret1-like isoform X1 n=2 Tax=Rhynchophorus ferrugineus TaxID=354439 RepID=UPI003FCDA9B7
MTGKVDIRNSEVGDDDGKQWPQIISVLAVSLGSYTSGMLFVWSSPFTLVIVQDKENYNISEDDASYFIIFHPAGMIFASLFFFKIAELLGRKKAVLFLSVPHILSWLITMFSTTKWEFYLARFVAGMSDTCSFCSIPPYVGEITTPKVRGFWGNIPTFILYGGQLSITVLGSYFGVKTTAYICICVPVLFALLVSFLPESPYQLMRDERYEAAKDSIRWLRRNNNVEEDFVAMKADVERQMSESGRWKDIFTIISNRRALRAGAFLRFSQQMCGIAVFASYTQPVFEKAGGNVSPQVSSMILIGLYWILNLVTSPAIERFGRRLSFFYSLLCCGTVLVLLSIFFLLDQYQTVDLTSINWFPLVGMLLWAFSYSFGLGVVPTLMLGELFSSSIKSKGLCILIACYGLGVFVSTNMFKFLTASVGLYSSFLIYGICCLCSTVLTLKWVPETKGKTLEEIQQTLKK